jgi:hypothetical protein
MIIPIAKSIAIIELTRGCKGFDVLAKAAP